MAKFVPLLRDAREVQSDCTSRLPCFGVKDWLSFTRWIYGMAVQTEGAQETEGTQSFPALSPCSREGYRTLGGGGCQEGRGSSGFGWLAFVSVCVL